MAATGDDEASPARHPARTDAATAEMDRWVSDHVQVDMNAIGSLPSGSAVASSTPGAVPQPPEPSQSAQPPSGPPANPGSASPATEAGTGQNGTARQVVTGVATGIYRGGKSLLSGLADLGRLVAPFTQAGMLMQLVDPHAPTAKQSAATIAGAAEGAYSAASHPVATFDAAHAAVQEFRKQFDAERAEAEKKGTTAEFYSQFGGRAGFEIVSAIVPAGKFAEAAGIMAKAAKGAEAVADAGRGARAAEAAAKAESLLIKARAVEPALTQTIQNTAESLGGKMVGLDNRLKTPESLARKITTDAAEAGLTIDLAASRARDVVRYTATFPPDKLVAGAEATLAKLKADGCMILKLKNTWLDPDSSYKGVNVQLREPNGQFFELQFHTSDSFHAKEFETHALYEKMRELPVGSPEWKVLDDQQINIARKLPQPDNIGMLKEVR